jgi:hypothetical protein
MGDPLAGGEQLRGARLQHAIDLANAHGELAGVGSQETLDAVERHGSFRQRFDLHQGDGVLSGVTPIARRIAWRFGRWSWRTALMVTPAYSAS